jgi:hypothetical protein
MTVAFDASPHGQAGQDRFAVAVTGLRRPGTFLDVGSGDPIVYSNSYYLDALGWRGLMVDRVDCRDVALYRNTPLLRADAMAVDWCEVLAAHGLGPRVDYLSFDLDDDGARALARLPWGRVRFSSMTVEHDAYRVGGGPRAAMRELLLDCGYRLLCPDVSLEGFGAFEDWWVDPGHVDAAVADRFATDGPTDWRAIVAKGGG